MSIAIANPSGIARARGILAPAFAAVAAFCVCQKIAGLINSPGGSMTTLFAIYDTMQYIKPDVSTIVMGQAASAAAVLSLAGAKGKRYALPHARILLHQPYGAPRARPSTSRSRPRRWSATGN